ncbi:MAG: hypothetical protein MI974_17990 [Chitinophagales bacterium]|nr:hypothetical protein [Chitinophagales bacterium]
MKPIIIAGLKYFFFFCLLYGTLTALSLIPQVGKTLNDIYRRPTQRILTSLFDKAHLQLGSDRNDVDIIRVEYASKKMVQQQMRSAGKTNVQINGRLYEFSFYNTFLSFYIFLLVLMILSPLPRKEMLIGLLAGSILFYLFSVFRTSIALLFFFNDPVVDIYHYSDFWVEAIRKLNNFLTLGINLLIVLVLWITLAFRKKNWKKLLQASK